MKTEKAVQWALATAADSAHGYDQNGRWGPDYDCSSLVISAWEAAGVPVRAAGASYTGNMRAAFLRCGFRDVTGEVGLMDGSGLRRGDVLLNERHHTAMHIGGGRMVQAGGNELGGITGGQTGDQTGWEIGTGLYSNFPWDCVLRYGEEQPESPEESYTVKRGDTLWGIAEARLGSGIRYRELMEWNGLESDRIRPGQRLKLTPPEPDVPKLPVLRPGDMGQAVASMQRLLTGRGYRLEQYGEDGDFGTETEKALERFQRDNGLPPGECGEFCWVRLIG